MVALDFGDFNIWDGMATVPYGKIMLCGAGLHQRLEKEKGEGRLPQSLRSFAMTAKKIIFCRKEEKHSQGLARPRSVQPALH